MCPPPVWVPRTNAVATAGPLEEKAEIKMTESATVNGMKLAIGFMPSGNDFTEMLEFVQGAERLGVDQVWMPEAYGTDAVSILAWLAAQTSRIKLGSAILQMPARAPAMTAMTGATLDLLSNGRALLGIGLSGPQVAEGWYGQPYTKPIQRTREYIEIMQKIWDREERLSYDGEVYKLPCEGGRGLGKPLKLMFKPSRRLPVYLASLGPKNVALTGELADGWLPAFFVPDRIDVFADSLKEGAARSGRDLSTLDIVAGATIAIGNDVPLDAVRSMSKMSVGFYIGGMGAREANFYNDLACRYGYEKEAGKIQELFLAGKKQEAMTAVPDSLVDSMGLWGEKGRILDRLDVYRDAGVTTLSCQVAGSVEARLEQIRRLLELANN